MNHNWNQDCWDKYQQSQICRWYHPNDRKWEGTKKLLDKGERGEWKSWLKTQHSKNQHHSIQSITSRQVEGEKVDAMTDYIFLGSKITADSDCSHKIKRCLLLGRKSMANMLDSILKSWDIILLTTVCIVKSLVFPVVIQRYESWTIKKAERRRIDAFKLWY